MPRDRTRATTSAALCRLPNCANGRAFTATRSLHAPYTLSATPAAISRLENSFPLASSQVSSGSAPSVPRKPIAMTSLCASIVANGRSRYSSRTTEIAVWPGPPASTTIGSSRLSAVRGVGVAPARWPDQLPTQQAPSDVRTRRRRAAHLVEVPVDCTPGVHKKPLHLVPLPRRPRPRRRRRRLKQRRRTKTSCFRSQRPTRAPPQRTPAVFSLGSGSS